jgi:hypothetical protein
MVMRSRAKASILGDDAVLPDRDFGDAVKLRVVANPTMITDFAGWERCDRFWRRKVEKRNATTNKELAESNLQTARPKATKLR